MTDTPQPIYERIDFYRLAGAFHVTIKQVHLAIASTGDLYRRVASAPAQPVAAWDERIAEIESRVAATKQITGEFEPTSLVGQIEYVLAAYRAALARVAEVERERDEAMALCKTLQRQVERSIANTNRGMGNTQVALTRLAAAEARAAELEAQIQDLQGDLDGVDHAAMRAQMPDLMIAEARAAELEQDLTVAKQNTLWALERCERLEAELTAASARADRMAAALRGMVAKCGKCKGTGISGYATVVREIPIPGKPERYAEPIPCSECGEARTTLASAAEQERT